MILRPIGNSAAPGRGWRSKPLNAQSSAQADRRPTGAQTAVWARNAPCAKKTFCGMFASLRRQCMMKPVGSAWWKAHGRRLRIASASARTKDGANGGARSEPLGSDGCLARFLPSLGPGAQLAYACLSGGPHCACHPDRTPQRGVPDLWARCWHLCCVAAPSPGRSVNKRNHSVASLTGPARELSSPEQSCPGCRLRLISLASPAVIISLIFCCCGNQHLDQLGM